ncbi:hypothetical protein GCM10022226_78470 [Sphaerisporangium flaviroseum]|uniref:Uncharacterized protein n=1 Tax=Sphaerisporangium flaviroseum TaxID=509199 RepID=A0ABP7JFJ1_9ACTN
MAADLQTPDLDQAFAGIMQAFADHAPDVVATAPDFSDIYARFAQLKRSLGIDLPSWQDGRDSFAALRQDLGMPPSTAPPLSPLLTDAHLANLATLAAIKPDWQRFSQPSAEADMKPAAVRPSTATGRTAPTNQGSPRPAKADRLPSIAEALRSAQAHPAIRLTRQWQRISGVARAVSDVAAAMRRSAGRYWPQLANDIRFQGFWLTVGLRTARVIADEARSLERALAKAGQDRQAQRAAAQQLRRAATTMATDLSRRTPAGAPPRSPKSSPSPRTGEKPVVDATGPNNSPGTAPSPAVSPAPPAPSPPSPAQAGAARLRSTAATAASGARPAAAHTAAKRNPSPPVTQPRRARHR